MHRDVKPSNVILGPEGPRVVPSTFAGTWTGGLSRGSSHWWMEVTLDEKATVGTARADTCGSVLTVQKLSQDGRTLTLVAVPTGSSDYSCPNLSELTLTRQKDAAASAASTVRLEVQLRDLTSSNTETAEGTVARSA